MTNYITRIETTGADLVKDSKYAWSKFVNQGIYLKHEGLKDLDPSVGIRWTDGVCYNCASSVDPYADHCSKCHYSFTD